jgi:hypothetical protein
MIFRDCVLSTLFTRSASTLTRSSEARRNRSLRLGTSRFDDLTLRGTYSEGFVVSFLSQLFSTPLEFQARGTDRNGNPFNALLVQGSNLHLKRQQSYSYYAEAVWVPGSNDDPNNWLRVLHGLTMYIDWFQIELRNLISSIPSGL